MKNKRNQIKFKEREDEKNKDCLLEAASYAYLVKAYCSFQGQKFRGDILALALNHIKLLDLGNSVDDVFRLPFP